MPSESARMTTAHEAAFRIQYPNSLPRAARIIALDKQSAALVDEIARLNWNGAKFFTSLSFSSENKPGKTDEGMKAWLGDIAGRTMDLVSEVAEADFVVVITAAGEDASAASVIAKACKAQHKTLVGIVLPNPGASEDDIAMSLDYLRPHTGMLVVASGQDYVEVMLSALRA